MLTFLGNANRFVQYARTSESINDSNTNAVTPHGLQGNGGRGQNDTPNLTA